MYRSPPPDRNSAIGPRSLKAGVSSWLPLLAVTAGLALTFAPWPGHAQPSPLGEPGAVVQQTDPPSRVATLTEAAGNLSFAPAGSDEWAAASLNRPITTGDRLWVDNGGRAELHAGAVTVRLGSATAVSVLNLDDNATQVKLTQGTLQLRVRALPQDQPVEIDTPNLAFVPREPGDYRLDVSPDGSVTTVTMRHGRAAIYGDSRSLEMSRGERMSFGGTDLADAGPGNLPPEDDFDRWTAARDAREDASPSARYVPRDMPGYAALDGYGDWQEDAGYGAVWFPRVVDTGWAPYSTGHWAWVAPWGWTWIDDAPWGFAPFHYGRWAYIGSRWGWVPGPRVPRPCYAPALVGFVGAGPNWSVRVGGGPGVAWYPLGPRDAYRPVYRASPAYVTRINRVNVNYVSNDYRFRVDQRPNRDVPGAIRGMPARNFVEGRPVPHNLRGNEWRNLPQGEARGAPPVAPVKSSLFGAAPVRQLPPQARQGFERQAIAARPPGQPAHDELARRFAREGGVVSGAGPVWRGGDTRPRGRDAQQVGPNVRMSQAAVAAPPAIPPQRHDDDAGRRPPAGGERGAPAMGGDPWRGNGRGFTTRPDQVQGLVQMPDAQRQGQELQRQQQQVMQRQQMEQQRVQQEQQRQGADLRRQQQQAQERQQWEQQRQGHEAQDQAQAMQRQQADQQRQQQAVQRQQMEQQRQMQDQQRQQSEQRHMMESQRQQAEQQRQMADQQRQQMEQQRQMQEQQRRAQEQQRAAQEQQRAAQEQQRAMQQQQQQQQQQQRAMQEQQRQQQDQQRQMQERQRQQQQQQQQQMDQQRQQQRAQHERGHQEARNDGR